LGGEPLHIALLDPFHGGSHAQWSLGYQARSRHHLTLFALPGKYWKWRMHGAAVELAEQVLGHDGPDFDLLLATDMMDLSVFTALVRKKYAHTPIAVYFHENQLAYPWSASDQDVKLQRDNHYAFINYTSALAADRIFFNSPYNHDSFVDGLLDFLKVFPDRKGLNRVEEIAGKSEVLPLGMELEVVENREIAPEEPPRILWNHRWEYDKGPEEFFDNLVLLAEEGMEFELAVLGEQYKRSPKVFGEAQEKLADRIVHWGYVEDRTAYHRWLRWANVLPVTSRHDFFGGSVVEALAAGVRPLLPQRLNYPHLCSHPAAFYPEGQFKTELEACLRDWPASHFSVSDQLQHFDWSQLAPQYDLRFTELVQSFS